MLRLTCDFHAVMAGFLSLTLLRCDGILAGRDILTSGHRSFVFLHYIRMHWVTLVHLRHLESNIHGRNLCGSLPSPHQEEVQHCCKSATI